MRFYLILIFQCFQVSRTQRYGSNVDYCIDGTLGEKSKSGHIKWCDTDGECSNGWKCTPSGQYHFSRQINYCCQMRESICSMPPSPGYGDCFEEPTTKYYFDSIDLKCKKFQVIKCHGNNQNQFDGLELCIRFCQSTACLAGQSLLLARDSTPLNCETGECPSGYRCVYDKLFNKHVCCGHSPTGVCPIGSVSYSHVRSNKPIRCTPSDIRDNCPADYVCTTQGLYSFCCSPYDAICPAGQQPYVHLVSKNTMKCNPMETSSCPPTYYCSPAVAGANWGFCCSVHVEASCPVGTDPFLDYATKTPVRCTVGVTQCNVGFSCQSSQSGSLIGFCCTVPKISFRLPETASDYIVSTPEASPERFFLHNEGLLSGPIEPTLNTIKRKPMRVTKHFSSQLSKRKLFQKYTKPTSTYGVVSNYKPALCPPTAKAIFYTGTQINVECTSAYGYNFQCPDGSSCVDAYMDLAGRRVCCQMPRTTPAPSFVYYVTSLPKLVRYRTSDPFCPFAIQHLQCRPSQSICPMGYFCQYLSENSSFSCCALY